MHVRALARRSLSGVAAIALVCAGAVVAPGMAQATECTPVAVDQRTFDLTEHVGALTTGTTYCLVLGEAVLLDDEGFLDSLQTATDSGRAPGSQSVVAGWDDPSHTLVWQVPAARHGVSSPSLALVTAAMGYQFSLAYTWDLTGPQAPTGLAAESTGPTSLHLAWDAATAGSFAVTAYDVLYRVEGDESFATYGSTDGLGMDLSDLAPSTTYELKVRARDLDDRQSPLSSVASTTTDDALAPTTPGDVAAEATGTSSLAVSWTGSSAGTYAVHHYLVRYRAAGTEDWHSLAPVLGTEAAIEELLDSTDYRVDVTACDARSTCSAPSDAVTARTDAVVVPDPLRPLVSSSAAITTGDAATFQVSLVPDSAVVEAGDLGQGVVSVAIDGRTVTVRTRHGFSGTLVQPLVVVDGLQRAEVEASVVVRPDQVSRPTYRVATASTSTVRWDATAGATSYVVVAAGRTVCTTTALSCTVGGLLGPASRVTVTSRGAGGTAAAPAHGSWTPSAVALGHVHFVGDTATLTASSQAKLQRLAAQLHAVGISRLTVRGYTATQDRTTRSAAQLRLSGQRAASAAAVVSAWYVAHHASVRIVRVAAGATHPVASNATYAGRAENRRAEVALG